MKGFRLLLYSFLICLPAVFLVTSGAWLIAANVPRAIHAAPLRASREYREIAEDLIGNPSLAQGQGVRENSWRRNGKIEGCPWGYVAEGENVRIWCVGADGCCRWVVCPAAAAFPHALVFYWGGGFVGLLLFALSGVAVACFVRFTRERDDFLAATVHDLTTPLVGMRRMIGRNDEEAKRLNERMILLVGNIRDFLRLGGRRKKPDLAACDVFAAAREAYALFADDYEDSEGGAVSFEAGEPSARVALADRGMLLQIFWNLFGNDLKYAAPYGKVTVRLFGDGRRVTVEFADEGPGMTAAQRRRAFDRYYRAKTVQESGKGGFGIGLCTSREFARLMGGELSVRANEPKGCVFALSLRAAADYGIIDPLKGKRDEREQ